MNIEFKAIDRSNYDKCIKLKTSERQKRFVASNMFSLVQSAYEPNLYPLGVYKDNKMVGFILYDFDDELNGWSMSRFMIDEKFQNQGIGKATLQKFIEFFIERYGHVELYTSAEVDNTIAINLYENIGFKKREVFEYEYGGVTYRELRMVAQL
ncbi:GNAT family N-acetyltransferase [Romboutsia weinsteinii]|uniref:GNAT family N-acetyltransferase n=1 Tax=Romboutsia weinsteinii TaxID=2020949 RepID=A0A371IYT6_9FIRM|nr:GNAT family N-acetyltransferase [Romboutsia weinsteinii]RDY25638.1 GNAT family N-acetyltransferase [Romboutsia weinsteinii]